MVLVFFCYGDCDVTAFVVAIIVEVDVSYVERVKNKVSIYDKKNQKKFILRKSEVPHSRKMKILENNKVISCEKQKHRFLHDT